uniref:Uncharacterized protein n=1 Tax=Aegilops tauschii subsp. strangulata TaxID=200361 RepID=A0A453LKL1_AEGTS
MTVASQLRYGQLICQVSATRIPRTLHYTIICFRGRTFVDAAFVKASLASGPTTGIIMYLLLVFVFFCGKYLIAPSYRNWLVGP